jgi:hypothetical protein
MVGTLATGYAARSEADAPPLSAEALKKGVETCQAEASSAFGMSAIDATTGRGMPHKTREAAPRTKEKGRWAGVGLIAPAGKVHEVWTVSGISDEADKAVADAIRKWKYEGAVSEGRQVPVCFLVIMNLK